MLCFECKVFWIVGKLEIDYIEIEIFYPSAWGKTYISTFIGQRVVIFFHFQYNNIRYIYFVMILFNFRIFNTIRIAEWKASINIVLIQLNEFPELLKAAIFPSPSAKSSIQPPFTVLPVHFVPQISICCVLQQLMRSDSVEISWESEPICFTLKLRF